MVEGGGLTYERDESVGTRLQVALPREVLGSLGEGSVRRNRSGVFSQQETETRAESGSSGSQMLHFCYPTELAATLLGPIFFRSRWAIQTGGIAGLVGYKTGV